MAADRIVFTSLIDGLFEKLASADLLKVALSYGIHHKLKILKKDLIQIRYVLSDAGQKHLTQEAVHLWLNELHGLAYDIDDLLDDLATEAMRRKLDKNSYGGNSTNKVFKKMIPTCCTNFTHHNIMYGRNMRFKLDKISTKLYDLLRQKNYLGLELNVKVEKSNRPIRRSQQSSVVDESTILGREREKEELLVNLLGDEACNQNVSVLSIIGMGGIGKTTLANVLYNNEKVKDHFELRAWICVSDEFNVFNISKAIYLAIAGEHKPFANLDLLHVALSDKLSNMRFLLVLDDVWNENYREWELLQRPFLVGAPGSKILVTTRKTTVASVMGSVQSYWMEGLPHEEALSLFAQYAIDEHSFNKYPTLKFPAEGIVKKCKGLPLALVALGRLLRTKTDKDEWDEILNCEIWESEVGFILPALRVSYYDLPSHLKRLFAYCSLFPKDYTFDKTGLVLLWMAEGFLSQSSSPDSMEIFGYKCFEELLSRSFFQHLTNNESQFTMHDLINDLAVSVAGEFFFLLNDVRDFDSGKEAVEKFRHLSFVGQRHGVYRKFEELRKARHLRTLLSVSVNDDGQRMYLPDDVLIKLTAEMQFLRVLSLTNHSITQVPQYIGSFMHIRYLNFSGTDIKQLPRGISDLYNLQSLLVRGCNELSTLPKSFVKLVNLRHLDIGHTPKLNKLPLGIGGLTRLQTLSKVLIERANGFEISDLKGLVDLQGQLSINGLDNVMHPLQAKDANLHLKEGLDELEMKWSEEFDDSRNGLREYAVLDGLRPHHKLQKLLISFYMGTTFPRWVGEPTFDWLRELTLRGCRSCTHLPTLGTLLSLQKLFVECMDEVMTISYEFLDPASSFHGIAFPSLEVLEFKDMQNWETWSTADGGNNGMSGSFPRLRELSIVNCPKLSDLPETLLHSLSRLSVDHCPELGKYWPIISQIPDLDVKQMKA